MSMPPCPLCGIAELECYCSLKDAYQSLLKLLDESNQLVRALETHCDTLSEENAALARRHVKLRESADAYRRALSNLHRLAVTKPRWVGCTGILNITTKVLTDEEQKAALNDKDSV